MLLYLIQNDLDSARHLWRRAPTNIKNENIEFISLWTIGKKLWQQNIQGTYEELRGHWSDGLKPLIEELKKSIARSSLSLIAGAYSKISIDNISCALNASHEVILLGMLYIFCSIDFYMSSPYSQDELNPI